MKKLILPLFLAAGTLSCKKEQHFTPAEKAAATIYTKGQSFMMKDQNNDTITITVSDVLNQKIVMEGEIDRTYYEEIATIFTASNKYMQIGSGAMEISSLSGGKYASFDFTINNTTYHANDLLIDGSDTATINGDFYEGIGSKAGHCFSRKKGILRLYAGAGYDTYDLVK
ncbi:MAG: hypothetical protein ACKOXB_04280 [Flavobacteriales bacterium]